MARKAFSKLLPAVGLSDFSVFTRDGGYFVDKTAYIKKVFAEDLSSVLLITRPRRFGKTLTLSMFRYFLDACLKLQVSDFAECTPKKSLTDHFASLFAGKAILKDHEFCEEYMGKYPVIFLSFKNVCMDSYTQSLQLLAQTISTLATDFSFLSSSYALDDHDKDEFKRLFNINLEEPEGLAILCGSLQLLTRLLHKHFKVPAILLLDEYDVPLAKAYHCGYYEAMTDVIRILLQSVLKDNSAHLKKAVITGCLKIAKDSIFTGLNNFQENTVASSPNALSSMIGFTSQEVLHMLEYYGLSTSSTQVKMWYDGYRFDGEEIYCPWDVVCFCDCYRQNSKSIIFRNFWINTSANDVIRDCMQERVLSEDDAVAMQNLLDGGSVKVALNEQMNYRDLKNSTRLEHFWTLLLHTGYLTINTKELSAENTPLLELKIPNVEIKDCFKNNILEYYRDNPNYRHSADDIVYALLHGDVDKAGYLLNSCLQRFVSVRDLAVRSKPESYYHGFLNGLFSGVSTYLSIYKSEAEAGEGYADIVLGSHKLNTGAILELKSVKNSQDIKKSAQDALAQIDERNYTLSSDLAGINKIYCYALVFMRKKCFLAVKERAVATRSFTIEL